MKILNTVTVAISLGLINGSAIAEQVVSAPFADSGQYRHTYLGDGSTYQSAHVELENANGAISHQAGLAGVENGSLFGTDFTHNRRTYYAFNLADVTETVTAATFRVWGFSPHEANFNTGVYTSDDASETMQLRPLDNFTADQVINAPYQQQSDHSLDVPIWEDLADGGPNDIVYGSRDFTLADEQNPGLIASPTASSFDCSDPAANACGKWFEFELTAEALVDINVADGNWGFGAIVSSITSTSTDTGVSEELLAGSIVDFNDEQSSYYPAFTSPEPELILTTVPVPAAVWLFGTALAGLVGVKRKK